MRLRWIPVIVVAVVATACGGDDDAGTDSAAGTGAPIQTSATAAPSSTEAASTTAPTTATTFAELPPPDPETFTGLSRVVNLYIDDAGETRVVDVWGRRTFTNGPVLLAEGIGFGEASDFFKTPDGYVVDIVLGGAGPDGEGVGSLFNTAEGEQATTLWVWDDQNGSSSWLLPEADPEPSYPIHPIPEAGSGVVVLNAMQLIPHVADSFARSFLVGEADTGTCLTQSEQIEKLNDDPIVGGTQHTYHVYPAGTLSFTLHEWPAPAGTEPCSDEPLHGPYRVSVPDGGLAWVFLYTDDGFATVKTLEVPWGTTG